MRIEDVILKLVVCNSFLKIIIQLYNNYLHDLKEIKKSMKKNQGQI